MDKPIFILLGVLVLIVAMIVAAANREPCPTCQQRGTLRWRHQRKDGGPDLRHKDNARFCTSCGWDSNTRAHAELAVMEADKARMARLQVERQEAVRRRAEDIEREAQAKAEAVERFRREREEERPVKAFVRLMKSVAKADRQLTQAEERAILEGAQALFPGRWQDSHLRYLLSNWDATDTPSTYIAELPLGLHQQALALVEALGMADGRTTPAEKRKIEEIRAAFQVRATASTTETSAG